MKDRLTKLFLDLPHNNFNHIVYFHKGKRFKKTFSQLSSDIDLYIQRLRSLDNLETVAILGPTSYEWLVIDLACLKGGFKSVSIPENLTTNEINNITQDIKIDLYLIDFEYHERIFFHQKNFLYFRAPDDADKSFNSLIVTNKSPVKINLIENYGIAFSSGTSEKIKRINLKLIKNDTNRKKTLHEKLKFFRQYFNYKTSFWSSKKNKIIFFMPFSHIQQRTFAMMALNNKVSIIISDPVNCLKHIITEKPNIMIAVPVFYNLLAGRIKEKIKYFSQPKKIIFRLYNFSGINRLSNNNPLKIIFNNILFKDVKKIYGGKADYFATGSAPMDINDLKLFYSIGVKIMEAYGQSETEIISSNTRINFRLGSVGKPIAKIKISYDSEILIKYDPKRHEQNKTILNIDSDDYIHTGDLGYLDKDGFLFLNGRKDDVIVLSTGKKIFPDELENKINNYLARRAVVVQINSDKIGAIFTGSCDNNDEERLINSISELNLSLESHEKINAFCIVQEEFTVENGLMTLNFKLKRNAIRKKYPPSEFKSI
jgi:long-subunit acyl-CoA synthetase (AMP-forming)